MKKLIVLLFIIAFPYISKGQFFGHKSIGIHQGIIIFNNDLLNNPNNANNKKSFVSEVDRHFNLSRHSTFSPGIGFGNYQNPDNRFETYQSTNFLRLKIGLTLHLPQTINRQKLHPNLLSPFFKVGYNFDVLNNTFKAIGNNKMNTNLRLSIGNVFRLSHELGLFWESSLNQRVNIDYRTFFQHNFGLCINLDERLKAYWIAFFNFISSSRLFHQSLNLLIHFIPTIPKNIGTSYNPIHESHNTEYTNNSEIVGSPPEFKTFGIASHTWTIYLLCRHLPKRFVDCFLFINGITELFVWYLGLIHLSGGLFYNFKWQKNHA